MGAASMRPYASGRRKTAPRAQAASQIALRTARFPSRPAADARSVRSGRSICMPNLHGLADVARHAGRHAVGGETGRQSTGEGRRMDERRFDRWTRTMVSAASRRGVIGGAATAFVAAFGSRHTMEATAAPVLTCAKNGARCDPANPGGCCSGACGKSGRQHRCKPARGAQGCTIEHNGCVLGMGGSCLGNRQGGCIVRDNGKPFCALSASCFSCAVDADCDRAFKTRGGVCITNCPLCQAQQLTSACAFATPVPMAAIAGGPFRHE
jgi:hypothetical protein